MKLTVFSDGGARGNPGPAACGYVIYDEDSALVKSDGIYIGETTNNQAEYKALIYALDFINTKLKGTYDSLEVDCYLDSELVVKQLKREYKVKNPDMIPLFEKTRNLVIEIGGVVFFTHIPREKNKEADRLVNQAIDRVMYLKN